ncbi:alpha/beta hydrolase family protein [Nocardia thailandica]|uniref:Alpha/beta hydrolase family protein n=1 Tax=Nocardia thailandica TaxID=257275 RepID=A0ABW6PI28_9NOCA
MVGGRRSVFAAVTLLAVCAVFAVLGIRSAELSTPEPAHPGDAATIPDTPVRIAYGASPDTFGDLYLPERSHGRLPVVVLIHGGGWQQRWTLGQFDQQSRALAAHGVAVWNIEYRRVGGAGGWPTTLDDVDAAVSALETEVQPKVGGVLDLQRVHVAGHSAGGQLAAWVTGHRQPLGQPVPGHTGIRIRSATLMAAPLDLTQAVRNRDGYVPTLLGGTPEEVPHRYRYASPIEHLPAEVEVTALHGAGDRVVDPEQSRRYVDAVKRAGGIAEARVLPGVGHGDFADPNSAAWATAQRTILGYSAAAD